MFIFKFHVFQYFRFRFLTSEYDVQLSIIHHPSYILRYQANSQIILLSEPHLVDNRQCYSFFCGRSAGFGEGGGGGGNAHHNDAENTRKKAEVQIVNANQWSFDWKDAWWRWWAESFLCGGVILMRLVLMIYILSHSLIWNKTLRYLTTLLLALIALCPNYFLKVIMKLNRGKIRKKL